MVKVGPRSNSQVNIGQQNNEAEVKPQVDQTEQARGVKPTMRGGYSSVSSTEATVLGGTTQHPMHIKVQEAWELLNMPGVTPRGEFSIPGGYGEGNVRTDRFPWGDPHARTMHDTFMFLVDCKGMDPGFVSKGIATATLVIAPKDFVKKPGSDEKNEVEIPLTFATIPAHQTHTRNGPGPSVPEKQYLAVGVETEDLLALAGDSGGLSFYIKLETIDGKNLPINRNGNAFENFEVNTAELKPARN